ncbi:hypothetical protein FQR65_LT03613 [Abscondita terminalis]|nr:hypothetical protein FQR65_LT03613 [Abscondita terminalis]
MMFDRLGDRDYDSFQPDEHTYLKDKIGFAKFGPPQMESGYDDAQNNSIDETYELIVNNNNRYAKWKNRVVVSFIYNCLEPLPQQKLEKAKQCSDYNPYTDITPVPVFVIRKCRGSEHPCRMFVDCDNRVYSSWDDYITTNKLNQYTMILPKHGRYDGDSNGTVLLETHATPSCSIQYTLAQHADSASSVAGIASGAVLLTAAVSAIPVAPLAISAAIVTGAGAGLYSIARSGFNLYDRATHGETMSITNSEARGAYLNIIAGTLGLVGAGATGATARFATQGVHIGEGARVTVDVLNIANTTLGAAALANASYEMYDTWRESGTISPLSLLQLGSSVLFFGNAVYNFKTANTIINEAQTNALQDHEKSLRSNRHRKTFNKLLKETIRQNNGNVQAGRAEVISTISTMSNRDDVLAVLTRNNRRFNKNGVCFAAEGGRITLNGIAVDLINMDIMSNNHRTQFLIDLPTIPNGNAPNPRLIYPNNFFETLVGTENTSTYTKYAMQIYQNSPFLLKAYKIMFNYSEETQTKIFKIFLLLLEQLELRKVEIVDLFREYDVFNESPYIFCLNSTIEFLKIKINEYERQFQTNNNSYSNLTNLGTVERSKCWLSTVINNLIDDRVDQIPVKELLKFVVTKLSSKIYNFLQRELVATRMAATTTPGIKTSCTICGGYYYVHQSADGGL